MSVFKRLLYQNGFPLHPNSDLHLLDLKQTRPNKHVHYLQPIGYRTGGSLPLLCRVCYPLHLPLETLFRIFAWHIVSLQPRERMVVVLAEKKGNDLSKNFAGTSCTCQSCKEDAQQICYKLSLEELLYNEVRLLFKVF